MDRPAISVIMSVYNGSAYLRESVESILTQTFSEFEFIILDDASTDDSLDLLRDYERHDSRIRLVRNESNMRLAASLNRCLRLARGKYIARHDADDIALPERFRVQFEFLEKDPGIFLAGGAAILIGSRGEEQAVLRHSTDEDRIRKGLPVENQFIHPSIMFRNDGCHFYRERFVTGAEDYDFYLRLLCEGKRLANVPDILLKYRIPKLPAVTVKHALYGLFRERSREFHRQRIENGFDRYADFNPEDLLRIDLQRTDDPTVLRILIDLAFQNDENQRTRELIRRYEKAHGRLAKHCLLYVLTYLGGPALYVLKRLRRRFQKNRSVFPIPRGGERKRHLALLFSTGDGLNTFARIGSLSRETALYKKLVEMGWRVSFYTYDRTRALPQLGFEAEVHPQWPFLFPRGLNSLYLLAFPILHYWRGRTVSAIMTNQAHSGWPAVVAGRAWRAKVIARCGWVYGATAEILGYRGWRTRSKIRNERFTFRHADRCIIPTRELADWVIEHYGVDPGKMEVIPNYVDTELFRPCGEDSRRVDVICVERLHREKRYDRILEALDLAKAGAVVVGDGPLRGELQRTVTDRGLDVQMLGRVPNENLPNLLSNAKVFLIASEWEGHSKALAEAMACGCACLGTRNPGIQNQIIDGETGLLVDPNPEGIRRGLERLLGDAALRRRLGENARRYAVDTWSLDLIASRYAGVLEGLLKERASAGGGRAK